MATGHVPADNMANFDLINAQCYGGSLPADFINLGYPAYKTAWGIDTEGCTPAFPTPQEYQGLAGIFNWTMSADSVCGPNGGFQYTKQIAKAVGYGVGS